MIASTQTNHPLANIATRPATVSPLLRSLLDSLHQAGLRITLPRKAILAGLLQQSVPVSIEQLHASLSPKSCDLVTVYRCLAAFEAIGVVRRSYFNNGTAMYQLVRADRPNYHLINRANGEAHPLDSDLAMRLRQTLDHIESTLEARGHRGVTAQVEFVVPGSAAASDHRQAVPPARGLSSRPPARRLVRGQ